MRSWRAITCARSSSASASSWAERTHHRGHRFARQPGPSLHSKEWWLGKESAHRSRLSINKVLRPPGEGGALRAGRGSADSSQILVEMRGPSPAAQFARHSRGTKIDGLDPRAGTPRHVLTG